MPSSNDRKISQLPLLTELKEDTTFLVVSDVGTTPKNERMHAQTLFDQIPSTLTIGQELNGKDVTFNTTLDATNRLHFDSQTGNLSLGNSLHVANTVTIDADLHCSGNVHFDSFTPNFANLEISGDFLCGNDTAVGNNLTVLQNTDLQADVYVRNDLHVANNVYVTELASIDKLKNNSFEGIHANLTSAQITSVVSNSIETTSLKTNTLNVETSITSNGYISVVGNITGDIGNFKGMNISQDISVAGILTVPTISATSTIQTPSLNATNLYSQNISSPLGTIDTFNSDNITTKGINANTVTAFDVHSANVTAQYLSANSVDITHFSADNFTANTIQANSVNTVTTITDVLSLPIRTVRPPKAGLPLGTVILFEAPDKQMSLEVLCENSTNDVVWKIIYTGNEVPA